MKKIFLNILIFFTLLSPATVLGQSSSSIGLSISPAIIEIAGDPGSKHSAEVNIRNTSDKPLPIRLEITSLIPIDNEIDRSRRSEFDASSWISVTKKDFLLKPGDQSLVLADIAIPKDANPGGHYAQIGFRVLSLTNSNPESSAQIVPEVAASIFITVSGDILEQASFNTDNLISNYVVMGSKNKLSFKILNTGNVHVLPSPKVTISDKSGNQIKQFALQPQLVLPNTEKEFSVDWPADVGFGEYSVRAETVYGSQNIPLASQDIEFKVVPPWWQIVLLIVLLIPPLYLLFRRQNLRNFMRALAGKRIHLVGKKRYRNAEGDAQTKSKPETIGDYTAISDFLGEPKREVKKLEVSEEMKPKVEAKPPDPIAEAMQKQPEQPVSVIPIKPKTIISEVQNTDDKSKKTVIVQTSASTIIRQEPKSAPEIPKTKPAPTIVRVSTPQKPKIKISVIDEEEIKSSQQIKTPPKEKAVIKPGTRAQKTAQKSAKVKRKKQTKKK